MNKANKNQTQKKSGKLVKTKSTDEQKEKRMGRRARLFDDCFSAFYRILEKDQYEEEIAAYQSPLVKGAIFLINSAIFWEVSDKQLRSKGNKFPDLLVRDAIDMAGEFEKLASKKMPHFFKKHFPQIKFRNISAENRDEDANGTM